MITDEEIRNVLMQLGEICANNFLSDEPSVNIYLSPEATFAIILETPPRVVSIK